MQSIYQKFCETAAANDRHAMVSWKAGGKWRTRTYGQTRQRIESLAANLESWLEVGCRVAIFAENRPEWLEADLAINKLGLVSVPIHASANQGLLEYIAIDADCRLIFSSDELFAKHEATFANLFDSLPDLKLVLFSEKSEFKNGRILLYGDLLHGAPAVDDRSNELASIIYTSGTTGEPKGVMLTNENILSNALTAGKLYEVGPKDSFLSFLPLSHILERTLGSMLPICHGASIAYAESIRTISHDLGTIKPTIIIGVPRIYEKTQQKIIDSIRSGSSLKQKLFYWSLRSKSSVWKKFLAQKLVHEKIRKVFGGRIRFMVSGGASINERVLRFFQTVGLVITEGYGLTETSPIVASNPLGAVKIGTVGRLLPDIKVKIMKDKEILVKGPSVMRGYWNKGQETEAAFTSDGWFKTGDLGFLDHDHYLTVIGRKKDIIVTTNGKNVYPEKIEALLNLSPLIAQSLVVGHHRAMPAALLVLDTDEVNKLAQDKVVNIHHLIDKELDLINGQLMPHERVGRFHLLDQPFLQENDELTPTLKVRRHVIENNYNQIIDGLFK